MLPSIMLNREQGRKPETQIKKNQKVCELL